MNTTSSDHNPEPSSNTREHTEQRPAGYIGYLASEHLITVLESIPTAFIALDTEWRVTYINQQAECLLQHTRAALLGKHFWEIFSETGGALSYIHGQQAVTTGKALQFEGVALGLKKCLRVDVLPTGAGLSVYFTDITQQKQAEAQLQFQATILRNVRDAVVVTNMQEEVIYWNEGARLLFGYPAEDMLGTSLARLFPTLHQGQLMQGLRDIMAGKAYAGEWHAQRKDGTAVWIEAKASPLLSPEGETVGLIGTARDITERKRAETRLEESEARFRSLSACSPVGIFVTDLQGQVLYTNPRWLETMGFASGDNPGDRWLHIVHPDDFPALQNIRMKAIQEGCEYEAEYRVVRPDGSLRWVRVKSAPMFLEAGELLGRTAMVEDVSERKQAEEAQAKLAAIVASAADAIFWITPEGLIMSWNEGAERIFGFCAAEIIGKPITLLSSPEHHRDFVTLMKHLRRGERIRSFETTRRRKDGTLIPVSIIASPIKDDAGAIVGVSAIVHDISEHKRLETEIRRAQQRLEAIFQHVSEEIIVQDANGKVVYANQAAVRLTGAPSVEALLTASPLAIFEQFDMTDEQGHPFSWTSLSRNRVVQEAAPRRIKLRWVQKHTQEVRWKALTVTSVCEDGDLPYLLITVMRDMTQEKELEQRKDDFIINVNHELRTPLSAVQGYLELLNDHHEQLDAATQAMFLSKALGNCQELIRLADTITDALKITQAAKSSHPEKLPLAQVVREVLDLLDPHQAKAYTIRTEIPEQLRVWAEKGRVRQVLLNLLSNVFKYVPQHTPVMIRAALSRGVPQGTETVPQIRISVRDAGPGIPLAEQPLLFEKFVRLNRDLGGTVRGTGLGLSISKQLVEAMGGHMWVESSGRAGEGSCFCFTLPAAPPVPAET